MSNTHSTLTGLFTDIADAIREKDGSSSPIIADNFPSAIRGIPADVDRGVVFLDYDGSIVASWDASVVASKITLPNNPTHTGLIAQGWNWSLADIKSYITDYQNAKIYVGQMYKTSSGLTEINITLTKASGTSFSCNIDGTKDWGDGTVDDTKSHTYANYGNYTIKCDCTSISNLTNGSNNYACTSINIGESVTLIGNNAFSGCRSVANITIPNSVTRIGDYAFSVCYHLANITIPNSVTYIGEYAFKDMKSLISIPNSIELINKRTFSECSFTNITIPNSVTYIGTDAFINCRYLTNITIPNSVTYINTDAFYSCYGVTMYDFTKHTTIPILGTGAFGNINALCKIKVPSALYDSWISSLNWASVKNYIEAV